MLQVCGCWHQQSAVEQPPARLRVQRLHVCGAKRDRRSSASPQLRRNRHHVGCILRTGALLRIKILLTKCQRLHVCEAKRDTQSGAPPQLRRHRHHVGCLLRTGTRTTSRNIAPRHRFQETGIQTSFLACSSSACLCCTAQTAVCKSHTGLFAVLGNAFRVQS